jgi:peptide/nickel transport system permease protein
MRAYIARRFMYMLLLMVMASVVSFLVITLPPGDYVSSYIARLSEQGGADKDVADSLRALYGLDQPLYVQWWKWITRFVQGDLGFAFAYGLPVKTVLASRIPLTLALSFATLILTYLISIPIGIYSAVRQYSIGDYLATLFGFIGVSVPDFLLALILMLFFYNRFNWSVTGLFSQAMEAAPWSWAKFVDLLKHLPVPIIVLGLSGTAWQIRTMRAMLLDELPRPYVQAVRAKGLQEHKLLWKYPIRVALLPLVANIGWALPGLFSGSTIVAIVLNLQTIGPVLYRSLLNEDMFLAASTVMITTTLTLIGTFISDALVAWIDPRIHYTWVTTDYRGDAD